MCPRHFSDSKAYTLNQRIPKCLPISTVLVKNRFPGSQLRDPDWVKVEWCPVICFEWTSLMKAGFQPSQCSAPSHTLLGKALAWHTVLMNHCFLWVLRALYSHGQYSRNHTVLKFAGFRSVSQTSWGVSQYVGSSFFLATSSWIAPPMDLFIAWFSLSFGPQLKVFSTEKPFQVPPALWKFTLCYFIFMKRQKLKIAFRGLFCICS